MSAKNRKNNKLPHVDDSTDISWEEYETTKTDVRDGLPPEEYIRTMRENDREEWRVER